MTGVRDDWRVGFLGAGQMATALAVGIVRAGLLPPSRMIASDVLAATRSRFASETSVRCVETNAEVVAGSDVLFLAVKPQHLPALLDEIRPVLAPSHLVVSIAAGVTLRALETLGPTVRVVRVMPNTPCLLGAGASAYATGTAATADDARLVERILSTVGLATAVPEKLLDAVTGLSGSGPAYVYLIIEALADGGVRMGLPRDVAQKLAAQTVLGTARMVLETGKHPGALKDAVASPGGTTIAGLHALERGGLRGVLMDAVQAATERSIELSKPDR